MVAAGKTDAGLQPTKSRRFTRDDVFTSVGRCESFRHPQMGVRAAMNQITFNDARLGRMFREGPAATGFPWIAKPQDRGVAYAGMDETLSPYFGRI